MSYKKNTLIASSKLKKYIFINSFVNDYISTTIHGFYIKITTC